MSSHDPFIDRTIAGFRLEKLLGEGGMGRVYRAVQLRLKRPVAVKILPHALVSKNQMFVDRFLREALTAAQVTHPNVVQVYDAGEFEGTFYIAMEMVDGQGLDDVLKDKKIFSVGQAVDIIIQAATGLAAAQKKNLVHRDIKPGNLMVTTEGVVKVADFGLAKNTEATHALTEAGQVLGTPAFMSPEQGKGFHADHRSDLYSLGVTLFALVTGTLPFQGETPVSIVLKHISDPPPDARERNPELPEELSDILLKVMEKDPNDRYQSAEEFIEALQDVREEYGEGGSAASITGISKPRPLKPPSDSGGGPTPDTLMPTGDWQEMHVPSSATRHVRPPKKRTAVIAAAVGIPLLAAAAVALAFAFGVVEIEKKDPGIGEGKEDGKGPSELPPIRFRIEDPAPGHHSADSDFIVRGRVESGTVTEVRVNGQTAVLTDNVFTAEVSLPEGEREIEVVVKGKEGQSEEKRISIVVDRTPPALETSPAAGEETILRTPTTRVSGTAKDLHLAGVTVNDNPCPVEGGRFACDVTLAEGRNVVEVMAVDRAGNPARASLPIRLDTQAPILDFSGLPALHEAPSPKLMLRGRVNEPLAELRVGGRVVAHEGTVLACEVALTPGPNKIVVNGRDRAGNLGTATLSVFYQPLPEGLAPGPTARTYLWERDGSLMVRVEGGPFPMGSKNGADEGPVHTVELSPFYIDVFEVTNGQYNKFLAAVGERPARDVFHPDDPDRDLTPRFRTDPRFSAPEQPVIGVDWYDAWAYAKWAGKSLPTECQWEKAASWDEAGKKKRKYPWGSVLPDRSYCNFGKLVGRTMPKGQYAPRGLSAAKCHDMAGNAAEWCLDWYVVGFYKQPAASGKDPAATESGVSGRRVYRGGSWRDDKTRLRCSARRAYFPHHALKEPFRALGFRCVYNPK
ncbi:MAG: protein kinase domain-containing protein [Planctomycetota bacterium]|jgi:serine/threonine-protein kinase